MHPSSAFNGLTYVSIFSVIIPLICCGLKFKTLDPVLRVLFFYLIISLLSEGISYFISINNNIPNYAVQHVYTVLECACIAWIYRLRFDSVRTKNMISVLFLLFLAIAIFRLIVAGHLNKQDSLLSTFESLFVIGLACGYFYKLMRELTISNLNEYYFFWINSGFLIYFCMLFFLFLFDSYLEKCDLSIYYFLYSLHLITNITYHVLQSIGIWKVRPA